MMALSKRQYHLATGLAKFHTVSNNSENNQEFLFISVLCRNYFGRYFQLDSTQFGIYDWLNDFVGRTKRTSKRGNDDA